ncbi:DUF4411 family protein [Companilactobacillus farciminis]|uniref:DUF4411 family protein n=1 Tax=Companilactobacillus farciminis TaxID=1612 RepID=UPI00232D6F91|nr:DUF4411 family protein [Companilactobacillus farciminis]WCG35738.1 DUF4411 family protein [Companilactobacillus farciminis]
MNGYLIDSNILINSNRYYRQKFFPVVWNFFLTMPNFYMLDRVYDELVSKKDDLCTWTKNNYKNKILIADSYTSEYTDVAQYLISSGHWSAAGYQEWTSKYEKADPWLIACAINNSYTIITNERNTGPNGTTSDNEPKIPFVAQEFNVPILTFWEFLEKNNFVAN